MMKHSRLSDVNPHTDKVPLDSISSHHQFCFPHSHAIKRSSRARQCQTQTIAHSSAMSPTGQTSSSLPFTNDRRFTYGNIVDLTKKCFPRAVNIRVSHFKLEPFSKETLGFAGVYDLLTIQVYVDNDPKTLTFFVKTMSPFATEFQQMIFGEEFKFFDELVPRLLETYEGRPWAARCFMAKDNILVLEDLRAQGFKITNKLTDAQLKSAIVSVARFHSASMLMEDKVKRPLDEMCPGYFTEKNFLKDESTNWLFMMAGVEVVEAVARNLKLDPKHTLSAYEWLVKEIKPKAEEKNVLCHCDLWCNNVMFDETSRNCRLVDFQMSVYTSHIVDLVQFIHLNVDRATKRRLEVDLIELYHTELTDNLKKHEYQGKMMTLKELTRDFERKRVIGLVTAVQTLPLALLNKEMGKEFTKDDEHFKRYMFESRRDFVLKVMKLDEGYKKRIEEAVEDLVVFMNKIISVER